MNHESHREAIGPSQTQQMGSTETRSNHMQPPGRIKVVGLYQLALGTQNTWGEIVLGRMVDCIR